MSVATLRHQVSCPSDFMRTTTVIPLEVSTSASSSLIGFYCTSTSVNKQCKSIWTIATHHRSCAYVRTALMNGRLRPA